MMKTFLFTGILLFVFLFSFHSAQAQYDQYGYTSTYFNQSNYTINSYRSVGYATAEFVTSGVNVDVYSPNGTYLGQFGQQETNNSMVEVTVTLPTNECGTYHLTTYHWQLFWYRTYGWNPSSQNYEEGTYSPATDWVRDYWNEVAQPNYTATPFLANPPEIVYFPASDTFDLIDVIDTYPNNPCPAAAEISSVEFEAINSPLDANPGNGNPNTNIGLRIFPDKTSPGDMGDHTKVRVKATVTPAVAGIPIYFKTFDLDDPSTNDAPIDSNGNAGDDNLGQAGNSNTGHLNILAKTTDSNGSATVELTVTKQPGDNFAVVASKVEAFRDGIVVDGINLKNGSQTIPISGQTTSTTSTDPAMRTQMLTVWRKLHIEVDSMGQSVQNFRLGHATNDYIIASGQTAFIDAYFPNLNEDECPGCLGLYEHEFQNGRVIINGGASLKLNDNTVIKNSADYVIGDKLEVTNTTSVAITVPNTALLQIFDDDDFNENNGDNKNGDTGEDIDEPEMKLVAFGSDNPVPNGLGANIYAAAYIQTERVSYSNGDVQDNSYFQANAFNANFPGDETANRAMFIDYDLKDQNTDNDYWTVYILGAYQPMESVDHDPLEPCPFGGSNPCSLGGEVDAITNVDGEGSGALIYLEIHRLGEMPSFNPNPQLSIYNTSHSVAHEIGHLFSSEHGDGGIMGDASGNMTSILSDTTIKKIRGLAHP